MVGGSDTEEGIRHATVWKIKYPLPPVDPEGPVSPPDITIVNATNSGKAMVNTASRGFKVLDLYQSSLNQLSQTRCQIGESDACIGVFSQYDSVNSNNRSATGVFGSLRLLPSANWTAGAAINFATHTNLTGNYDTRGINQPGVGIFTRYQSALDGQGLNIELSGSLLNQKITVTRDQLKNTEPGKGDTRIKGYQSRLSAGYGIKATESTLITPTAGIDFHSVVRDGYTENRDAEFVASYGKMGNKRTDLQLGLNLKQHITDSVQLDASLGANVKLDGKRDAFTGKIDYISAYTFDAGKNGDVNPYVSAGLNISSAENSTVRISAGWQKTDYSNDAAQVGLSYSYHW